MTSTVDINNFKLVPVGTTFTQQVVSRYASSNKCQPITELTFKVLLIAAANCVQYAKNNKSEIAIQKSTANYNYYYNQIDMDQEDALSMFMYTSSQWSL